MDLIIRRPDRGYLDTLLWVPKTATNVEGTKRALTFQFFDAQKVTILTLYKETEHHLLVPREFWNSADFDFPVIDCRPRRYAKVAIHSKIRLDHRIEQGRHTPTGDRVQENAMQALLKSRGGLLQLACGRGKTVIALDFIARRAVPAIIILDTTQLMHQWREALNLFLDIPGGIGLIQGDNFDWQKPVVLATYHSLATRALDMPEEARKWFGTIVWDEGHHIGAPTFAKTADLFYGMRLALTATPDRSDGLGVVYKFHLGNVIYKDLTQDLVPRICFVWTGLALDIEDAEVLGAVNDKNGELHLSKIAGFLGQWRPRINFLIDQVRAAVAEGRKVLVLSKSADGLINALSVWNGGELVSDIPFPTAAAVGASVPPHELTESHEKQLTKSLHVTYGKLKADRYNVLLLQKAGLIEQQLEAHRVFKECEKLWNKQRSQFLKTLLAQPSTAGLMIHRVHPDKRTKMLREKQVTFAISKYGREGLDESSLDTVIINEPISDRNALQQVMGRVLRSKKGKKEAVVVFLEDNIGPLIGMCQKLRRHLSSWPEDEGGPFDYENIGHMAVTNKRESTWKNNRTPRSSTNSTRTFLRAPGS